jgi:hypothetical protein
MNEFICDIIGEEYENAITRGETEGGKGERRREEGE